MRATVTIRAAGETLAEKRTVMKPENYKNECKCEPKNHIEGIKCNVEHCAYHNGKNDCYAGCISVGPNNAESSSETVCATFKPREF